MRVQLLASGSKGNMVYVESGGTRLLVDIGISCREAERRLLQAGLAPQSISAILVTHSHIDHIRGIGVFSRKHRLPVYLTRGSHLQAGHHASEWFAVKLFKANCTLNLGDLRVEPFPVPHDAEGAVAFTLTSSGGKFGMATDLGHAPHHVAQALAGSHLLLVEANHDEQMLWEGPYPDFLKNRIASRQGHLSNGQCLELLERLVHPGLQGVILGHLSEQNNTPARALAVVRQTLQPEGRKIPLKVASQHEPSRPFILKR